ncbi:hypothetical protein JCM21900_006949 [Sporobolomyces salmonicolor]
MELPLRPPAPPMPPVVPDSASSTPASFSTAQFASSSAEGQSVHAKPRQPRVGRACDTCRRRKVRCDGGGPGAEPGQPDQPCVLCAAQGIPCTFEQRPTKRGPPKGYVESLERRLEAMENLLATLSPNDHLQTLPHDSGASANDEDLCSQFPSLCGSPAEQNAPEPTGLDAIDELGSKLDDLVIEAGRYVGRGSGLHLIESMQRYATPMTAPVLDADQAPSIVDTLMAEEHKALERTSSLPPPDLAAQLVDATFREHVVAALIPRSYFEECVKAGLLDTDTSFRALYFMVCALGSRIVDDPRIDDTSSPLPARSPDEAGTSRGWTYFRAAFAAQGSPLLTADLFAVQTSVLSTMWMLGAGGWVVAWTLVGFAIRRAVDVGVHCEARARWTATPMQDQLRKRAFCMLTAMDYYVSMTLGRPFALHEDDTDLVPPLDISDAALLEWDRAYKLAVRTGQPLPPTPSSPQPDSDAWADGSPSGGRWAWDCVMRMYRIMARTMRQLYGLKRDKSLEGTKRAVRELDSELNAWLDTVPARLRWNPTLQDNDVLARSAALHALYYSCQILIHREFVSPSRSAALEFPSLAICSNAARSIAHVLDTMRQRGLLERAFHYASIATANAALLLLLGKFASPNPNASLTPSAANDVKRCIHVLDALAPTTWIAMRCRVGIVNLACRVASPPPDSSCPHGSDTSPTEASNPLASSLKRANPEEWNDGQSPAASSTKGDSERPSPADTTMQADERGLAGATDDGAAPHKTRRLNRSSNPTQNLKNLPLSTLDLSCSTFNGRPTFWTGVASDGTPTSMPAGYPNGQQQNVPPAQPGTNYGPSIDSAANFLGSNTSSLMSTPSSVANPFTAPASIDFGLGPNPFGPMSPPTVPPHHTVVPSFDFDFASPEFWTLPTDNPSGMPPDVNQAAADLLANFGAPGDGGGGASSSLPTGSSFPAGSFDPLSLGFAGGDFGSPAGPAAGAGTTQGGGTNGTGWGLYDPRVFSSAPPFQ